MEPNPQIPVNQSTQPITNEIPTPQAPIQPSQPEINSITPPNKPKDDFDFRKIKWYKWLAIPLALFIIILTKTTSIIFTIIILVCVAWSFLGIPLGIIFGITYLVNKKAKFKKIALLCFGGIPAMISAFLVFFILNFFLAFLGISFSQPLPLIK